MLNPRMLLFLSEKIINGTDKLTGTEIVAMTLVGLLVVFAALLILIGFLYITGGIFDKTLGKTKHEKPPAEPVTQTAKPVRPAKREQSAPAAAKSGDDEEEIIAAIMAAVCAMGDSEGRQYRVRSVRQTASGREVWSRAGRADGTRPF